MKIFKREISNERKGMLLAQSVGIIATMLSTLIYFNLEKFGFDDYDGLFSTSQFFLIPVVMGILSVKYLEGKGSVISVSVNNWWVTIIWAAILMGEGYICLLIVSPIILISLLTGAYVGRHLWKKKNNTLNSSVFGMFVVIYLFDILTVKAVPYEVSDTLIVNAPASKVWPNVVAFDEVEDPSEFWLFDIGLPKVVAATVTERKVGGDRKCVFENGIAFDEKIVVYEPEKDLTFDIVKMPEDPEIIGHIDLKRGQFNLTDNGDGTTTLEGISWYDLKVFPAWYYNIWAESITRNVHLRAMKHIKKLSER